MPYKVNPLDILIEQFRKLPGIGAKSAQKIAFHIMRMTDEEALAFTKAITDAKHDVHPCGVCQNLTDKPVCRICENPKRDHSVICVVAEPSDVLAIEKTNEYNGLYHVLHGLLSPAENIGPADIRIKELLERLRGDEVKEIILATNPTVEGDATLYLPLKTHKAARYKRDTSRVRLPVGGDLEYADELTLMKAMENRREI